MNIKQINEVKYIIEKEGNMNANIIGNLLLMPDAHEGYGFPVGGVLASPVEDGIVSPGICGFDINCGVRVIKTNLTYDEIKPKLKTIISELFKAVPSGVGSKIKIGLTEHDIKNIGEEGVNYIIDKGIGIKEDIDYIEENGSMKGANIEKVSQEAIKRGIDELGTIGAGNHFLELQRVEKIYDDNIAKEYGLFENQVLIMLHTGSRGFGHQIASDYIKRISDYNKKNNIKLVDPELGYAHISNHIAIDYLEAMKAAVNYAFTNREIITHNIRTVFERVFNKSFDELGLFILYDVAHNIIKEEEHIIENRRVKVFVHRKGATRAFPKGRIELPKAYRDIGQPVLIPGSMGTSSYILSGMPQSLTESLGSTCHGAGRVMSRHQAVREIPPNKTLSTMREKGIEIMVKSKNLISEEAEWAYKDVDEVVSIVEKAGISKIISKNKPIGVMKG